MKKLVSLLLAVCMCLSIGVMLTACGHEHTYQIEWSKDETHHWHACDGEDCTEVADKTEHTWNEGEITMPATAEADGVKTFTCTVCGRTKDENVKLVNTLTKEEWISCLNSNNFTVSMFMNDALSMVLYRDANALETKNGNGETVFPATGQTVLPNGQAVPELPYVLVDEKWYGLVESDDSIAAYESSYISMYSTLALLVFFSSNADYLDTLYDQLSYDKNTKEYTLMPDALDDSLPYDTDIEYYRFYCEGGKILTVEVKNCDEDDGGIFKLVYSNWGSTTIEVPEFTIFE